MKAEIDRIEDGKHLVIYFEGGSQLVLPREALDFETYEGQHLKVKFSPDPESEEKTRERVRKLREELLNRTKERKEKK
ncbi:MAG: DUF3006 domain-containing protein [Elusimicrobia bacterium]|nr:DUF3006 domain-containing protein [Elusimicrobiota bacterium]